MTAAAGNTSAVFGAGQAHASTPGRSGDFYATGDARNIWGSATKKKKSKKKKVNGEAVPLIRRTLPGM